MSLRLHSRVTLRAILLSVLLSTAVRGGIPVETLHQGCRALLSGGHGQAAADAMFSIRSWIKSLPEPEAGSGSATAKTDPTQTIFKEARNPVWCAASIEQFIIANRDVLPESLSDSELLPIWWASVHPSAEARHKEWVQARLKELKSQKSASAARKG